MTKTEIKKIVEDEIKIYLEKVLDDEIAKLLKTNNSKTRRESTTISKNAVGKLAEFMWVRKSIWQNDIK